MVISYATKTITDTTDFVKFRNGRKHIYLGIGSQWLVFGDNE